MRGTSSYGERCLMLLGAVPFVTVGGTISYEKWYLLICRVIPNMLWCVVANLFGEWYFTLFWHKKGLGGGGGGV